MNYLRCSKFFKRRRNRRKKSISNGRFTISKYQNKEKNLTKSNKKALTENNNLIQQREAAARELEAVQTQENQSIISSFVLSLSSTLPPSSASSSVSTPFKKSISSNTASQLKFTKEARKFLDDMLCQAKKKVFPKKEICVENRTKSYTSYLNFTESISTIKDKTKPVEFKCIFCSVTISVCIGATANVLTHLKLHKNKYRI